MRNTQNARSSRKRRKKELRRKQGAPSATDLSTEANGAAGNSFVVRRATTHKGRKILQSREPQIHEGPKISLILKGHHASMSVQQLLTDLHTMRKPHGVKLTRSHENLRIFEDASTLEFLCEKNESSLFCIGSTTKKRPFNICFGRIFDGELLDVYEFAASQYLPMSSFEHGSLPLVGSKPLMVCQGAAFESSEVMKGVKNMLCDFFSCAPATKLSLKGVEHVVVLTAVESTTDGGDESSAEWQTSSDATTGGVLLKHFMIQLKKSAEGATTPRVELREIGPSLYLKLDRFRMPDADRWKAAMRLPKVDMPKKTKNFTRNTFGEGVGRVHVGVQPTGKIYTPHYHLKGKAKRKETAETARSSGKTTDD